MASEERAQRLAAEYPHVAGRINSVQRARTTMGLDEQTTEAMLDEIEAQQKTGYTHPALREEDAESSAGVAGARAVGGAECAICGRGLEAASSVAFGIGPKCAGRVPEGFTLNTGTGEFVDQENGLTLTRDGEGWWLTGPEGSATRTPLSLEEMEWLVNRMRQDALPPEAWVERWDDVAGAPCGRGEAPPVTGPPAGAPTVPLAKLKQASEDRDETIQLLKTALKARTGRAWSVTGGRGTAWGWIRISAPPKRQGDFGRLSQEDAALLAEIFAQPVGNLTQGHSIPASGAYRLEALERAHGATVTATPKPYWD